MFLKGDSITIKNYKKVSVQVERTKENLCTNCYIADSFLKRFKGLMLAKPIDNNEALLITKTNSIHMFFMKYELDIVFLDKNNVIIDIIISMKKRRISKIYKKCKSVVELKSRKLVGFDLKVGDKLIFIEKTNE